MTDKLLGQRTLDLLNRVSELKSEIDFCGADGGLQKEVRHFMRWLGNHLRFELQREAWEEPEVVSESGGVSLYLSSSAWRLPADNRVALLFWWPNPLKDELPSVMLCLPAEDVFPPRNDLLNGVRAVLKRNGFTDYYEGVDADPSCPIWRDIRLQDFHQNSGFDLDSFVAAILDGFKRLLEIESLIEDAMKALPEKPAALPAERRLKTIAFLDTEFNCSGNTRTMTELAIINVAYDVEGDAVVGILEEFFMEAGQTLDETKARSTLARADFIVAHGAFSADKPLLSRHLPGTERMKWLCSLSGIDWRGLLDVQSQSLETLMGKVGLRYHQDHNAIADAQDLKRLLSVKHAGRTYLGRLLDGLEAIGSSD